MSVNEDNPRKDDNSYNCDYLQKDRPQKVLDSLKKQVN